MWDKSKTKKPPKTLLFRWLQVKYVELQGAKTFNNPISELPYKTP